MARSSPHTPLPVLGRLLHILSSLDGLFYPLVLGPLYLSLGPWFIGEVLTGSIGIIREIGLGQNVEKSLNFMLFKCQLRFKTFHFRSDIVTGRTPQQKIIFFNKNKLSANQLQVMRESSRHFREDNLWDTFNSLQENLVVGRVSSF